MFAMLLLASMVIVASDPLVKSSSGRTAALSAWLRAQLGDEPELAVEAAVELAVQSAANSPSELLLRFSRALVQLDGDLAARLAGVADASPEELIQALVDLFGRTVSDALAPRHLMTTTQASTVTAPQRIDTGVDAVMTGVQTLVAVLDVVLRDHAVPRPLLRLLSSARPLGP